MKWTREQYLELMTFGDFERPMFVELFGPLIGLPEEWRAQGASEDEINMVAFDWDYVDRLSCGVNTDLIDPQPTVVLEESDTHRIVRDGLGRTMRLDKRTATIPLPMDYPVKTMDDWLKLKHHYVYREDRIDWNQVARARQVQQEGSLVVAGIPGAFDTVRNLMGEENGCVAYYLQPEIVEDIMATLTDTACNRSCASRAAWSSVSTTESPTGHPWKPIDTMSDAAARSSDYRRSMPHAQAGTGWHSDKEKGFGGRTVMTPRDIILANLNHTGAPRPGMTFDNGLRK